MKYKIFFKENGKKRQASIFIPSWDIKNGESIEDSAKRNLSNGASGPIEIIDVSRVSSGRFIEGVGNPRKYRN